MSRARCACGAVTLEAGDERVEDHGGGLMPGEPTTHTRAACFASCCDCERDACQHGVHYRMTTSPEALVMGALRDLRAAREALKLAGARRSADRVRLAISSTLGALRHARHAEARAERRARRTQEGGAS